MKECIFCKIVKGEIPCHKVYEDEEFLAFLDVYPNTKGMTLVITKKHYDSYAFDLPEDVFVNLMKVTKKISKILDKNLEVKRTAMVMEGMGVNHVHIKLYPLHGLKDKFKENWAKDKIFFDEYQGYLTTKLGPEANKDKLKKIAEKIRE